MPVVRIIRDAAEARRFIARNRSLTDREVSPELLAGLARLFGEALSPEQATARIVSAVRERGDEALREWSQKLEGVVPASFAVSADELDAAFEETPLKVREALARSAERVRAFHKKQLRHSWLDWEADGTALGQMLRPLERVGVYAPGGRAPYPSSLLMAVVPAQVAGVREIIVCSPPQSDGHVAPVVLAAARTVGVDKVFAVGGAQAIAAMAYGTPVVPRVDKIVGAGGLFVTLAKRQVFGQTGIDGLYGPTETLLIADESAQASWVAADLLAQAEHDPLASSVLLTTSRALADAVALELERQMAVLPRRAIVAQALAGQGAIVVVGSLDEALELANLYAPEHLCLLVRDAWSLIGRVQNAGGVFVGHWTSEALGDYAIGPSHIMPTSATARFGSPLNVNDFQKIISIFMLGEPTAARIADTAITLAEAEGLTAHANAVRQRLAGGG